MAAKVKKSKDKAELLAKLVKLRAKVGQKLGNIDENILQNNLFLNILEDQIEKREQDLQAIVTGKAEVDSEDALDKGIQVFLNLRKEGFATYLAPLGNYWRSNKKYLQASRQVALEKGGNFTRVYILPAYESLFSGDLQQDILEDEAAGIQTKIAFSKDLSETAYKDFGIWDNELLCLIKTREIEGGKIEVKGGVFSRAVADLNKAREWRDEILQHSYGGAEMVRALMSLDREHQLLLKTVHEAEKLSKQYCRKSYLAEGQCKWYHLSWQYLRLLGLVSSPFWHSEFYASAIRNQLGKVQDSSKVKILISGLADYAMLQHVHKTLSEYKNLNVEIVVLDFCPTPLELSRLYSRELMGSSIDNITVNFVIKDARDTYFKDNIFDIVLTDAFLTRFPEYQCEKIVAEWHRILKPGGIVATSIKIDPTVKTLPQRADSRTVEYYINKASKKLAENSILLKPLERAILEKAELYSQKITSYPFGNIDQIKELFLKFDADINLAQTDGELVERTNYARVLARKD